MPIISPRSSHFLLGVLRRHSRELAKSGIFGRDCAFGRADRQELLVELVLVSKRSECSRRRNTHRCFVAVLVVSLVRLEEPAKD
jgi:hypothetical protein